MTAPWPRCFRRIAPLFLALGLTVSPAITPTVRAQEEAANPEGQGEQSGRALDGYFGTAILAMLALFLVGKSARR